MGQVKPAVDLQGGAGHPGRPLRHHTQSVVDAIIGEMMGAQAGLGYLLVLGHETYDVTLTLAALVAMSFFSLIFYLLVL